MKACSVNTWRRQYLCNTRSLQQIQMEYGTRTLIFYFVTFTEHGRISPKFSACSEVVVWVFFIWVNKYSLSLCSLTLLFVPWPGCFPGRCFIWSGFNAWSVKTLFCVLKGKPYLQKTRCGVQLDRVDIQQDLLAPVTDCYQVVHELSGS